eukprot:GFUD01007550.1.p1 GENE.GFUD01007550.1~~GFUD01007550.1.p1  ORF type:complete len:926 (+),score=211.08 GFUD01007550.1:283-3060(+)
MEEWMLGPPLLIGDRVAHVGGDDPVLASVRWLGRLPELYHHQMVAGVLLDEPQILGTSNGSYGNRHLFHCHPHHGKFVPISELVKEEEFFNILARQQRDVRSVSRSSSRSDRNPLYMNHTATQPTYQNHFFEKDVEWQDRQDWLDRQEWEEAHNNTIPPNHRTRWGDARWGDWHEAPQHNRHSEFAEPSFEPGWRARPGGGGYGYTGRNTAEDVRVQPTHSYQAQDSYENTEQPRETSKISYPNNPVFSQDNLDTRAPTEFKKTSADNPFRCKSSQSSVHDETEVATNKGVDTFKALLVGQGEGPSGDLLRQLEVAITKGDHKFAASLAKDLAKLKISSRLTEQESDDKKAKQNSLAIKLVKANMFVEDAVSAQGPIVVEVNPVITVAELKLQIEKEFEIPVDVQKWILGKNLVSEDSLTLQSQGIDVDGAEIFLYLVNPAEKQAEIAAAGAIPEVPKATVPPKIPLVLPTEPFQKGRYWNYEEDRWSVCNSDDDDEREEEVKQMVTKGNVELAGEVAAAAAAVAAPNEDEEWEYYYEDVDIKAKANKEKPNPIQEQPVAAAPVLPQLAELPKTSIFRNLGKADEPKPAELKPQVINNEPVPGTSATPVQELVVPKDAEKNPTGWECPVCTLMNPLERPGCLACTTERPADLGAAAAPDQPAADNKEKPKEEKKNAFEAYKQLENLDIIPNAENFECTVCFLDTEPGDGVVLRECLHTFCKICLAASIEHSDTPKVKCPFKDDNYSCDMELLEREIKALVTPAILEKHQKKSVNEAAATIQNAFHCKTPDCAGWTVIEDNVNIFKCQVCKRTNCITCQAIHDGMDCKQYQQYMLVDAQDENSKKTKEWMDDLIGKGEALHCPSCQVLLLKKWGCDWVRCTYCRTEICWVTKQLRWGPNGRGDTSGGCKCMIDGRTKCHKNCNYCH